MSDIGVGAEVKFISINGKYTRIILDRYDGTLREIYELIEKMHDDKILHRDLSMDNIVYKKRGEDIEYALIDFGLSAVVKNIDNNIQNADDIFINKPTSKWEVYINNQWSSDWMI